MQLNKQNIWKWAIGGGISLALLTYFVFSYTGGLDSLFKIFGSRASVEPSKILSIDSEATLRGSGLATDQVDGFLSFIQTAVGRQTALNVAPEPVELSGGYISIALTGNSANNTNTSSNPVVNTNPANSNEGNNNTGANDGNTNSSQTQIITNPSGSSTGGGTTLSLDELLRMLNGANSGSTTGNNNTQTDASGQNTVTAVPLTIQQTGINAMAVYQSPAYSLDSDSNTFKKFVTVYNDLNDGTINIQYAYRSAGSLTDLQTANFQNIVLDAIIAEPFSADVASIMKKSIDLTSAGISLDKYVQLKVTFAYSGTVVPNIAVLPAVYSMEVGYDPIELIDQTVTGTDKYQIRLKYAQETAPKKATIVLTVADNLADDRFKEENIDLSSDNEYVISNLELPDGWYQVMITDANTIGKHVLLKINTADMVYEIQLGNFTKIAPVGICNPDLNGDGQVNVGDLVIFQQLYSVWVNQQPTT